MTCRVCTELERMMLSATEPDDPKLFAGLNEAGKRNRDQQHAERILKTDLAFKRHRASFHRSEIEGQPGK